VKRDTRNRVLRNTGLYLFIATVFMVISLGTNLTVGHFSNFLPYLPDDLKVLDISLILIPAIGGITFIYLAGIFSMIFEGKLNQVLIGSLYSAGIVGFLAFFLMMRPNTRMTGFLIMGVFSLFVLYTLFSSLADVWRIPAVRVIAGSATLFISGQIIIQLVIEVMAPSDVLLNAEQIVLLNEIINWGFTTASVLTLFGIFKDSRNSYLSSIGSMTSSYAFVLGISMLGSIYLSFIRGRMTDVSPVITELSPYVEWTGIVLIAAMVFTIMRRGMTRSMISPAVVGSWAKHVQDTSLTKGEQLDELTGIIDDFVERGNREHLLVRLFHFLRENRVSEEEMKLVLSEVINFRDKDPPAFSLRGSSKEIEEANVYERMGVLMRTVRRINSLDLPESQLLPDLRIFEKSEISN
jgi:hypothetical protein